ncbi:MAG: bifunctional riboflavin kinase/FAD synthetase [Bryobacteraceae bacterium]
MAFRIHRGPEEIDSQFGPCALTIGNFDGLHAGHRRIVRRAVELARANGWKASALTFHPHPAAIVAPERAPQLLTTPEERAQLMEEEGIEQVLILPFTHATSLIAPGAFARDVIAGLLGARAVLVGDNFRFGHLHAGGIQLLEEIGGRYGFAVEAIPAVRMRGRVVSSSEIRRLIAAGRVSLACRFLERPYTLAGEVVRGHGIGSQKTVPTLNLAARHSLLPATGVYVTRTREPETGRMWPSVTNLGYRPTFDGSGISIETFLLTPLAGDSPRAIRVEFLLRLRDERKFPDAAALKSQILKDVARAQKYFRLAAAMRRS